MASAALPYVFRAVEIDGVPYWDGGYTANPPIFPFFRTTDTEDVLVVQINPVLRPSTPQIVAGDRQPRQRDHLQLLADRRIPRHRVRPPADRRGRAAARHRAGRIPAHQRAPHRSRLRRQEARRRRAGSTPTSISSRCCTAPAAAPARRFLDEHFDDIGVRCTIDLRERNARRAGRSDAGRRGSAGAVAATSFRGAPKARTRNPGPRTPNICLWIPGSLAALAPRNDK